MAIRDHGFRFKTANRHLHRSRLAGKKVVQVACRGSPSLGFTLTEGTVGIPAFLPAPGCFVNSRARPSPNSCVLAGAAVVGLRLLPPGSAWHIACERR